VGSSKYVLPRLCLPPHGSEYSGTSEYSNYRHHLTPDVQFSRYMVLGDSFPGTAGLYTSSKSHSRISVDIRARRHIGIGLSVMRISLSQVYDPDDQIDAPNFYDSPFWNDSDPKSGLGGWGDPNADYSVPDGAFHTLPLSYPVPHIVRRNFSLLAPPPPPGAALSGPPPSNDPSSFTTSVVESVLNITPGEYEKFQIAIGVRTWT
jgi:hypothetical protein